MPEMYFEDGFAITKNNIALLKWSDVQNQLEILSVHHATIVKDDESDQDVKKWATQRQQAFDRAAYYAAKLEQSNTGLVVVNNSLLLQSSSRGANTVHRTSANSCNCEAGSHGVFCLHLALATAIESAIIAQIDKQNAKNQANDIPF